MCGICGVAAFSDSFPVDEAIVTGMRDTLAHRGPDGAGTCYRAEERVALGHRRLAIVDLSPAGAQPMANEDGTVWITYNGEVYNHVELREELEAKGHRFRSRTDTEAVVHLYEEEGPRCVERLHGMFALAIWDARRRELFLARDRLGVKPLYYAQPSGGFVFGSEAKALLAHPAVSPTLDETALFHYLTFAFAPTPSTLYGGIRKLAPAERMLVRPDGSAVREIYWSPLASGAADEVGAMSERDQELRLRELLRESIRKRMMSDVPFGVFLSGGLDSSANVALMSELADHPVRTFSTAPRGHARYDELEYARVVARRFGTEHHEVVIDEDDLEGFVPELVSLQDEPHADWTSVPQNFVSKLARDSGTSVIQVGEGSDELLHGYDGYALHRRYIVPFQRYLPPVARRLVAGAGLQASRRLGRGSRHVEALYDAARSSVPYWGGALCFRGELKREIVGDGRPYPDSISLAEGLWRDAESAGPGVDLFQKMTYLELKQRLAELLLMRLDKVAMAHSVEGREPYLDHELVEFALALPPAMKHRDGVGKYALRRAMRGVLPDEIIDRPKQGFGTPMPEWLRGRFGERAQRAVARSTLVERGAIDGGCANALFEAHRAGRADWSYQLWNLYNVCAWHDRWVAGIAPAG